MTSCELSDHAPLPAQSSKPGDAVSALDAANTGIKTFRHGMAIQYDNESMAKIGKYEAHLAKYA